MKAPKDETGIVAIVAANMRRIRKEAGLSQEALAHEADVDRTYISQIERCQKNITITVLAKLATALGVRPETLLVTARKNGRGTKAVSKRPSGTTSRSR